MKRVFQISAVLALGAAVGFLGRVVLLSAALADSTWIRRSNTVEWTEYRVAHGADGGIRAFVCGTVAVTSSIGSSEVEAGCTNWREVGGARATAAIALGDSLAQRGLPQALKLEAPDGGVL